MNEIDTDRCIYPRCRARPNTGEIVHEVIVWMCAEHFAARCRDEDPWDLKAHVARLLGKQSVAGRERSEAAGNPMPPAGTLFPEDP